MRKLIVCLTILGGIFSLNTPQVGRGAPQIPSFSAPVLKWSLGGCYASWCETGWYSSPAVADLDGDGVQEVVGAAYSVVALNGENGSLEWRVASGADRSSPGASPLGRTWPGVVVSDLDGDGSLEIVTAHGDGIVAAYTAAGYFKPGWPQQPLGNNELRSLGVFDLEGDGDQEIMIASTRSEDQWTVLEPGGQVRSGDWPQHSPDSAENGYTAGCYNQNLAAGDLDGDQRAEIIGPNDTHYLAAFEDDGQQVRASLIYGTLPGGLAKPWSGVGVHVDHEVDKRGYANCGVEHRPNFANSAPVIADLDQNGRSEVVIIGNVYNCDASPYMDLYEIPFILNGDRTRWTAGSYDWAVLPTPEPGSAPLSEDYNVIENNAPNPAVGDLDGDGKLEIVYPSYDGRVHAYWLDKTQHGSWPFEITQPAEGIIRFASEPVIVDLDGNGQAEVIVGSWTQKGSNKTGKLHIISYDGSLLYEVDLPAPKGDPEWNGSLAAPTLANLDSDADLEIVLNTAHSGLAAYDLPGSAAAKIWWGSGRGSQQRYGSTMAAAVIEYRNKVYLPIVY